MFGQILFWVFLSEHFWMRSPFKSVEFEENQLPAIIGGLIKTKRPPPGARENSPADGLQTLSVASALPALSQTASS